MADFPEVPPLGDLHTFAISSMSECGLAGTWTATSPANIAWPAANRAIFVPMRLPVPATVYKMATGSGTLTAGNFDLGIYDTNGNLIISTGATAKTTASSERIVDVTDTRLMPGMYYLAMSADGTDNYTGWAFGSNTAFGKLVGLREMESAYVLPATATLATYTSNTMLPNVAAFFRSEA